MFYIVGLKWYSDQLAYTDKSMESILGTYVKHFVFCLSHTILLHWKGGEHIPLVLYSYMVPHITFQGNRSISSEKDGFFYHILKRKTKCALFTCWIPENPETEYVVSCFSLFTYGRLALSRSPRDSLKYFEILVPRHIRKKNRTPTFHKWTRDLTPEVRYW